MTIIQGFEIEAATWVRDYLKNNKAQLEADLGPVEVIIENGVLKVADDFFAKLPFGIGAIVDAFFKQYANQIPGDINQYVGVGIDYVVAYLTALIAHLQGSPSAVKLVGFPSA